MKKLSIYYIPKGFYDTVKILAISKSDAVNYLKEINEISGIYAFKYRTSKIKKDNCDIVVLDGGIASKFEGNYIMLTDTKLQVTNEIDYITDDVTSDYIRQSA